MAMLIKNHTTSHAARFGYAAVLVAARLLAASPRNGPGQNPVASQPAPAQQAQPAPLQIGSVTVDGSIRTRVQAWDWFNVPPVDNNYAFPGALIRLGLGSYYAFNHNSRNVVMAFPKQVYLRLKHLGGD